MEPWEPRRVTGLDDAEPTLPAYRRPPEGRSGGERESPPEPPDGAPCQHLRFGPERTTVDL